jgi:hypothetical protein
MSPSDPVFTNYFSIGYNDEEFVLQFGRTYQGQDVPAVLITAITTPGYARRLRDLLNESLIGYELEHLPPGPVTQ